MICTRITVFVNVIKCSIPVFSCLLPATVHGAIYPEKSNIWEWFYSCSTLDVFLQQLVYNTCNQHSRTKSRLAELNFIRVTLDLITSRSLTHLTCVNNGPSNVISHSFHSLSSTSRVYKCVCTYACIRLLARNHNRIGTCAYVCSCTVAGVAGCVCVCNEQGVREALSSIIYYSSPEGRKQWRLSPTIHKTTCDWEMQHRGVVFCSYSIHKHVEVWG